MFLANLLACNFTGDPESCPGEFARPEMDIIHIPEQQYGHSQDGFMGMCLLSPENCPVIELFEI